MRAVLLLSNVCADGSEWLKPCVKELFSCKLADSNREYSVAEKCLHSLRYHPFSRRLLHLLLRK